MKKRSYLSALVAVGLLLGPVCSYEYPMGLRSLLDANAKVEACVSGELDSSWGGCVSRWNI